MDYCVSMKLNFQLASHFSWSTWPVSETSAEPLQQLPWPNYCAMPPNNILYYCCATLAVQNYTAWHLSSSFLMCQANAEVCYLCRSSLWQKTLIISMWENINRVTLKVWHQEQQNTVSLTLQTESSSIKKNTHAAASSISSYHHTSCHWLTLIQ